MFVAGYYSGVINGLADSSQSLADSYIGEEDLFSKDHVKEIEKIRDNYNLENVFIVSPSGDAIDVNGKQLRFFERYKSLKSLIEAKLTRGIYTEDEGAAEAEAAAGLGALFG